MEIELSEDLQHYKESFLLGLTVKQTFFSILALGTGTAIVLLLYTKIGVTLSCYAATPFVVPLALTGFYNYHGLNFWQFARKMIHFAFFNRPLLYWSTESVEELKRISSEIKQEKEKAGKRKEDSKMEMNQEKSGQDKAGVSKRKKKKQTDKKMLDTERKKKMKTNADRKRGRNPDMVTVTQKRKGAGKVSVMKQRSSAGVVVMRAVGMIFAIAGLFAAGAATAAVWYSHFR